ncbi:hypothetical protein, partial [Chrysiogenes arsenatis]|uniref:hypothetical protein n=1 Tax=Chrysiogenes arsenatis TaxID=309797 RepID=UPI0005519EB0
MRRIAYGIALVALLLVFGSMWLQHSRLPTVQELQGAAQLLTSDRLSMERYAADGTHVATVTAHQVTQGV